MNFPPASCKTIKKVMHYTEMIPTVERSSCPATHDMGWVWISGTLLMSVCSIYLPKQRNHSIFALMLRILHHIWILCVLHPLEWKKHRCFNCFSWIEFQINLVDIPRSTREKESPVTLENTDWTPQNLDLDPPNEQVCGVWKINWTRLLYVQGYLRLELHEVTLMLVFSDTIKRG